MKTRNRLFSTLLFFILLVQPGLSLEKTPEQTWLHDARGLLAQGQFRQCIQLLNAHFPLSDHDKEQIKGLLLRGATARQSLGQFQDAYDDLKQARLFSRDLDPGLYIKALTRLSDLCLSVGQIIDAQNYAKTAADEAKKTKDLHLQAVTLNNLGNTLIAAGGPKSLVLPNDDAFVHAPDDLIVVLRGKGMSDRKIAVELIKFSQFRDEPVELLTLSACETAVGDEVAAFGLAGGAVKSGARSVLASLWQVSDEATKELMTEFYRQYFQNSRLTKAQALQIAQKKLIAIEEFNHPSQ